MKKTRAMLWCANTRKMLDSDRPMTAENSQKAICAPLTLIEFIRALMKNTNRSGAKITTQRSGLNRIGP